MGLCYGEPNRTYCNRNNAHLAAHYDFGDPTPVGWGPKYAMYTWNPLGSYDISVLRRCGIPERPESLLPSQTMTYGQTCPPLSSIIASQKPACWVCHTGQMGFSHWGKDFSTSHDHDLEE